MKHFAGREISNGFPREFVTLISRFRVWYRSLRCQASINIRHLLLLSSFGREGFAQVFPEVLVNFRRAGGERHRLLIIVNGFINNRSYSSGRRTTRKYHLVGVIL